ncbi:MAG: hypothetical protein GEU89_06965 [Kiloniellaceae bacterium]|nr:hypothetical protein [Kiloniellaceae bacterium]
MPLLRNLLIGAARRIAGNPEVQARAAETYRSEVKPRLQAAGDEWRDLTRDADPLRDPAGFARRLGARIRDVNRRG